MNVQVLQKKFPLIIALACGILAVFLLQVYLKQREEQTLARLKQLQEQTQAAAQQQAAPAMSVVLVAKRDIPPETLIAAEDIEIRQVPEAFIQPGAANALEGVIGQIASGPMLAGEQILTTKLLPAGNIGKALSEITPKGKRAMTIPVDNISVISGFLQPGDFVDVLALLPPINAGALKQEKKGSQMITVPFLQGIEVLAVGSEYVSSKHLTAGKKEPMNRPEVGTVTLSLSLQETLLLTYVQERGKVKLVMHSAGDTQAETANLVSEAVLAQYIHPEEVISPTSASSKVEVYRGLNKEIKSLSEE
jgi:pilus assembly protein CpaB